MSHTLENKHARTATSQHTEGADGWNKTGGGSTDPLRPATRGGLLGPTATDTLKEEN